MLIGTSLQSEAFEIPYKTIPSPLQYQVNGIHTNGLENEVEEAKGENKAEGRWSFPPVLEEFNLMDSETDPAELEVIFADER